MSIWNKMSRQNNIIIRPLLTEKSNSLIEGLRKYAFQVLPSANKNEIKKTIENKFNVKVLKVATMNFKGKNKSMSVRSGGKVIRTNGNRSNWKKAIVTLEKDNSIDLVNGDFS